ncbi:host cell division inhibitor Icd-like protein [Klebsiella variicola]|uniref:host cell division inhibitor Icd-like protein n=1 Tax=Klebsiella variicola TaxID=244366 RepID=UPI00311F787F
MILRKSAVQEGAFNLAGLLANVSPKNLTKPNIHRRVTATICDNLEALSGLRIGLRILINPKFFSHFVTSTREKVFSDNTTSVENYSAILSFWSITRPSGEFSDSIKKGSAYRSDHQRGNQCYSPNVAAKSVTGRGNPNTLRATQTPKASFFVSDHYAHQISGLVRTVSMVALVGLRSRRPVSFVSGISTPANVTAISERGNSGGDSLNTKEAAYMLATTHTQNPQFIWLIAAVRRDMPTITAKIHHIAAETEHEARRTLARDHVCFFAGRIRLEVAA